MAAQPDRVRKHKPVTPSQPVQIVIDCPACKMAHLVPVTGPKSWTWNGSLTRPTMSPSIAVRWDYGEDREAHCCHFHITHGSIKFESDCTHAMAGQTVELAPIVEGPKE